MQSLLRVVLAVGAVYVLWAGILFFFQSAMIYPGRGRPAPALVEVPGRQRFWIVDGHDEIEAWFLPPIEEATGGGNLAPCAVLAHGNGELIDDWPPLVEGLRRLGWAVTLVEFPGYGRSGGAPSERSITATMVAAYDSLTSREDVDPARIVAVGRSLGAGAACALADQRRVQALVLLSPFTSVRTFAGRYLLPGFLVRDPFDNASIVSRLDVPVLVVHGRRDETIPYEHGETLARKARNGRLISYDTGHNDTPPDWHAFWGEAAAFLKEHDAEWED